MLKAIPRSKATTAWGLLQDVKRAIQEEPKRADMSTFIEERRPEDGGPACGTVGCIAGWICLLRKGKAGVFPASGQAASILGYQLNYETVPNVFDSFVFNAGSGDACERTAPGTKAHANAIIARINRFMKINQKALKARKLP